MNKDLQKKILQNDSIIGGVLFIIGLIIIIIVISGFFTGELYFWEESILYFIIGFIPIILGLYFILKGIKKKK